MENNDKGKGVLCEDMLAEILSRLPIKSLMRFKCLSKYFQSFILDPRLARMHLQNSPKSSNFLLSYRMGGKISYLIPSPISSLMEDSTLKDVDIIKGSKPHRKKDRVLGSCNGLVCLAKWNKNGIMFNLWNPATKEEFGNLTLPEKDNLVMLGFGYDNSRNSYKVVAIVGNLNTVDNFPYKTLIGSPNDGSGWREIQNFPSIPTSVEGDAVYVNNTLNWLGIPTYDDSDDDDDMDSVITLDGVVIVSLDLETETYTQMLLPRELKGLFIGYFSFTGHILHCNEAPFIGVLGGCLSVFVHDRDTQHFSIWQMKEFGNQRSWTLLMNTSLKDLEFCTDDPNSILVPLCMVENDRDIVIIHSSFQYRVKQTIVYNLRNKTVTYRNMTPNLLWVYPFHYVESLISPIA